MLGNKVNFKKAKIPSKNFLKGRYVLLEPININKHSKDLYANFSKDKKIEFGLIYHTVLLKFTEALKNG